MGIGDVFKIINAGETPVPPIAQSFRVRSIGPDASRQDKLLFQALHFFSSPLLESNRHQAHQDEWTNDFCVLLPLRTSNPDANPSAGSAHYLSLNRRLTILAMMP